MLKIAEEMTIKVSASSSPAIRTTVKDGMMAHARKKGSQTRMDSQLQETIHDVLTGEGSRYRARLTGS